MSESLAARFPLPYGMFITIEGLEGSGKSTQSQLILEWFLAQGYDAILVREPGGTPFGQALRQVFFQFHEQLCGPAEIGILLAAKAELLDKVIWPALGEGKVVICDRFTDTLYAYQHGAKDHPVALIDQMVNAFNVDVKQDYTLFFAIPPELAVERARDRQKAGGETNNLDTQPLSFHQWVHDGFAKRFAEKLAVEYAVVDGAAGIPDVILHDLVIPRLTTLVERISTTQTTPEDEFPIY